MGIDEKVKRLSDLLAKATPGEWQAEAVADKYDFDKFEDAELVAAMKNTLPLLLAERAILKADKQTSGLVASVLLDLESWLSDPRLGQWPYMEGDGFSRDLDVNLIKIRAAIAATEGGAG